VSGESPIDFLHQTLLGDAWDNAEVAAVVFDDDRRFITVNHAYCDLTGYSREEITQLRAGEDLVADEETKRAVDAIVAGKAMSRARRGTVRRRDGGLVEIEWVTIRTKVSSLPYFIGLVWPTVEAFAQRA